MQWEMAVPATPATCQLDWNAPKNRQEPQTLELASLEAKELLRP
jgi:hypothetical protein